MLLNGVGGRLAKECFCYGRRLRCRLLCRLQAGGYASLRVQSAQFSRVLCRRHCRLKPWSLPFKLDRVPDRAILSVVAEFLPPGSTVETLSAIIAREETARIIAKSRESRKEFRRRYKPIDIRETACLPGDRTANYTRDNRKMIRLVLPNSTYLLSLPKSGGIPIVVRESDHTIVDVKESLRILNLYRTAIATERR